MQRFVYTDLVSAERTAALEHKDGLPKRGDFFRERLLGHEDH